MAKIDKAIKYVNEQVAAHSIYVWSGQGEKVNTLTARKLAEMENSPDNASRVEKFIYEHRADFTDESRCFDCSGLICKALESAGIVPKGFDTTADGLYMKAVKVKLQDAVPGDLVFRIINGKATHVGMIVSESMVAEARGRNYGVCYTLRKGGSWDKAGRIQ